MIFFITGMGRSGTKFLSNLLNQCDDTLVLHEPVPLDRHKYVECFNDEDKSSKYIEKIRKNIIIDKSKDIKNYGEVNSFLRRHVVALKESFPEAKFLHLVRDGRDAVKSIYARRTFISKAPAPAPEGGWKKQSRFEKICWYWNIDNVYLAKHIDKYVNLERIVSDYDYFKKNVLDFLGLELSKEKWDSIRKIQLNATKVHKLEGYKNWTKQQKRIFSNICGETMSKLGYTGSIDLNYFNLPVGFKRTKMYTTERMVEIPFVLNNIEIDGSGRKILDFGCSKSLLVLQFASQGYKTIGVDFRPYPIKYPNFKFYQMNVLNLPEKNFDIIVALSVVEHIGLGAYNKNNKNTKLEDVINKLYNMLKLHGKLILTFPMGISYTGNFLHCFTYEEAWEKLLSKFTIQRERFYLREGRLYWRPCRLDEIRKVSNAKKDRVKGGNSVACYVLRKDK